MSRKISQAGWLVFSLAFFLAGLIVLLRSVKLGLHSAHADLLSLGGMDTDEYRLRMTSYIDSYRWVGGILLFFGCLGLLFKVDIGRLTVGLVRTSVEQATTGAPEERQKNELANGRLQQNEDS